MSTINEVEENRLKVRDLMRETLKKLENNGMFNVVIITKDVIRNSYDATYACFDSRYYAEEWLANRTKNKKSYYSYCCDCTFCYNISKLLVFE